MGAEAKRQPTRDGKRLKMTRTSRALVENPINTTRQADSPSDITYGLAVPPSRLSMFHGPIAPITYRHLAQCLHEFNSANVAYYLDTNILTGEEKPLEFWDALLRREIVIAPMIWKELQPWLETPFRNARMRYQLLDARLSEQVPIRYRVEKGWNPANDRAWRYYVHLLSARKQTAFQILGELTEKLGRRPTGDEFDRHLQPIVADHEFLLMKKVHTAKLDTFIADEELVASAVVDAIVNRRDTTIITTDTDLPEHFRKLVGLLDWQYQAMLFAERYVDDPKGFVTKQLVRETSELECYFADDEGMIVRKPHNDIEEFVRWLLPVHYSTNTVECILLGGRGDDLTCSRIVFRVEHDMLRLLNTKACTDGRNTPLLNGANCHVTGFPIGIHEPRRHVLVVRDHFLQCGPMRIPLLEYAHANFERGVKVE